MWGLRRFSVVNPLAKEESPMKRTIIFLVPLALAVVLIAAACSSSPAATTPPSSGDTPGVSFNPSPIDAKTVSMISQALSQAPGGGQQTGIWVSGNGEVSATPDIATLNIGIDVVRDTVDAARTDAANAMDAVVKSLTANGIKQEDIKTQYFSIQPRYTYTRDQPVLQGYQVSNSASVKIRKLDTVGKAIDDASKAGGNLTRINSISFTLDKPELAASQARELARKDATV